jgi:hypothetical protein
MMSSSRAVDVTGVTACFVYRNAFVQNRIFGAHVLIVLALVVSASIASASMPMRKLSHRHDREIHVHVKNNLGPRGKM